MFVGAYSKINQKIFDTNFFDHPKILAYFFEHLNIFLPQILLTIQKFWDILEPFQKVLPFF